MPLLSALSSSLKPKPKPKTYAQVFDQLVSTLCDQGNSDLYNPVHLGSKRSINDLETIYSQLALQRFESSFAYNYSNDSTTPPDIAPNTRIIKAFDGFHRLKIAHQAPIHHPQSDDEEPSNQHLAHNHGGEARAHSSPPADEGKDAARIIDELEHTVSCLPPWAIDDAKKRVIQKTESIIWSSARNNAWTEDLLSHVYEVPVKKYDNSLRENVIFLSVHGSLTDGKVKAEIVAFYCIGVYYYTLSDATLSKRSLWDSVCVQANKLLDKPLKVSNPPTSGELTNILDTFGSRLFSKDFGIDLDSEPDDCVEFYGRARNLFVFEDNDLSGLENQLNDSLLSHLKLPTWTSVPKDIIAQTKYLVNDATYDKGDWTSMKLERSYLPSRPSEPTVVVKANFVHSVVLSPRYPDVSFRCVYITGLIYKAAAVKDTIGSDFIKAVYTTARSLVPDSQIPVPDAPTKDDLDALLFTARDSHFEKTFGFPIDGENTEPPSAVPGAIYTAKGAFESETAKDAASLVDTQILKAFKFPAWSDEAALKRALREDLVLKIQTVLKQDPLTVGNNQWIVTELDRTYPYAAEDQPLLCGKLIFVYCNGSMTLGNQNATLKKTFMYFSGVYYNQQELDW